MFPQRLTLSAIDFSTLRRGHRTMLPFRTSPPACYCSENNGRKMKPQLRLHGCMAHYKIQEQREIVQQVEPFTASKGKKVETQTN